MRLHHLPLATGVALFASVLTGGTLLLSGSTRVTAGVVPVIYVDASATGANNGSSWEDAYTSLQTALAAANSGAQVWVADGMYTPGAARADSFPLETGVALYGGFAGGETALDQRDPLAHASVLSGEIGAAGIADNSYHVIEAAGVTSSAVLDGFTIRDGHANGVLPDDRGAGVYTTGSPTLRNLEVVDNTAAALTSLGGGLYTEAGNPVIERSTFEGNQGGANGGGAVHISSGTVAIRNSTFTGNTTTGNGGALGIAGGTVTLSNVTMTANDGATGEAIHLSAGTLAVRNSIAWETGGADAVVAGGTATLDHSTLQDGCPAGATCTAPAAADPMLGSLAGNAGLTRTMALPANSPAVEAGNNATCTNVDQRGANRPFNGDATGTAACDHGAYELILPRVRFALSSSSGPETTPGASLAVELSAPNIETVTVNYAVPGGTATGGGVDYTLASGTLTFAPGDMSETITALVADDALDEADENFRVRLSNPARAVLGARAVHTYTIEDNEDLPIVGFASATGSVREGQVNAAVVLKLTPASGRAVSVMYTTSDGTAAAGEDFAATSGKLTFTAGQTTRILPVAILDDSRDEPSQAFTVTLSAPTNGTLGQAAHTRTIVDNDPVPGVQFTTSSSSVLEGGTAAIIARLSSPSERGAAVEYEVVGGSAEGDGADYSLAAGTLTFGAGVSELQVPLVITDDFVAEPPETVVVRLLGGVRATIGTPRRHTMTILNDDAGACRGVAATLVGTTGPDIINGTADRDVILGRGGDDIINGLDGDDVICAGFGDDLVRGGGGDDRVFGDGGADRLLGVGGDDRINGGPGDDAIGGGTGADFVVGASGDDQAQGGNGADRIAAGEGDDAANGGGGRDAVLGQAGRDRLGGGAGPGDRCVGGTSLDAFLPNHGCEISVSIP
jgi:hypothetical protein